MKTGRCYFCHPVKIKILAIVGLLIITALVGLAAFSQFKNHFHEATAQEYQAKRSLVLHQMREAVLKDDWRRLQRIEKKYGKSVKDPEFITALHQAKATVHGNETRKTFVIGKLLDISRQQEAEKSAVNDRAEWLISTAK